MGLILQNQLRTNSTEIIDDLLHQPDEAKILTERAVYKLALKQDLISPDLYERLSDLYHERNRVVHRYIISDITTEQVIITAAKFADAVHEVNTCIRRIEDEQIRLHKGMTTAGATIPDSVRKDLLKRFDAQLMKKHGNPNLARNLRADKKGGAT
jgi:hypothetical protein